MATKTIPATQSRSHWTCDRCAETTETQESALPKSPWSFLRVYGHDHRTGPDSFDIHLCENCVQAVAAFIRSKE